MQPKTKKRLTITLAVLVALVAIIIIVDLATAVRPEWPALREGDPVPARPSADDPPFHTTPFATTFEERRTAYLEWVAEHETPESRGGIWTDLAKLELGAEGVTPATLEAALAFVNAREDTSDFVMAGLIRLYYLYGDTDRLTSEQKTAMLEAFQDHYYWLDEPNQTYMELWTENHQILANSAQYLAGQLLPDDVFSNNGELGTWHMQTGKERLMRWIDWRARTGMAEWDSITYYRMDIAALLNLVDFAEDPEVAQKAAMMVDLLLFDVAVDSYYGQYGTSHGRVTAPSIKSAAGDSMITLQALVWGVGRFQSAGDMSSVSLATSPRYQLPPVIEAVGQDVPEVFVNYERQSIPVTDEAAELYGLHFDSFDDIPIWWGMGAFTHPKIIDLTIDTAREWDLWHYPDFRPLKDLAGVLESLNLLSKATVWLDPDPNGTIMDEVNKITYRTPDYMLSSAQDYRPGEKGYQQHIWQATLSPYAVVFVTNPDSMYEDRHRPNYWSSQGRLPRTGQVANVLVSLYDIDRHPSPSILEERHYAFTHAYFPRWAFDEVVEVPAESGGGWIFGRAGDGYVALYSHEPYAWQTEGPDAGQEVIALGRRSIWICHLGRESVDGSFEAFVDAVSTASLRIRGLSVTYDAPGLGTLEFGWEGPLTLDSDPVPLHGYPRWDNPYTHVEFGDTRFEIALGEHQLLLDFETGERQIE